MNLTWNALLRVGTTIAIAAAGIWGGVAVAPADQPSSGQCGWQVEVSPRTVGHVNVALPDTGAWYWLLPYVVRPGMTITATGRFPDARYMSFNTYDARFSSFTNGGIASALPDYRIAADSGSNNPWQHPGGAGTYTVTIAADARSGRPNAMPLAPDRETAGVGYLIYRVYLPAAGIASVQLPQLRITDATGTRMLAPCVDGGGQALRPLLSGLGTAGAALPPRLPDSLEFHRVSGAGAFPNVDNAYLTAVFTPPSDGRVIVVRGKAPKTPTAAGPTPWPPTTGTDVRYFSLCTNLTALPGPVVLNPRPDGSVDNGCRTDRQTTLDSTGTYTYVLGTESQRSQIESIPGATFVPLSAQHPTAQEVLLLRNMLPVETFSHAVQKVPVDSTPQQAGAIMGEYYPHATISTIDALKEGRAQ